MKLIFYTQIQNHLSLVLNCDGVHSRLGCLIEKGLQKTTLNFCLSYIIIIVVDCCMPIDKMMSFLINKNILK
jgi:hypothetical protein